MNSSGDTTAMASVFDRYAAWYDAFNEDKDYAAEANYLLDIVHARRPFPRNWLDVGCGTGHHLAALHAHGIAVEGVDISPSMIAQARVAYPHISFHVGSAQNFQLPGNRDVISMLFHAMSYQTSDAMIRGALQNISVHSAPGGLLLFDFWHTEAVLRDPPTARVRDAEIAGRRIFRLTQPVQDRERHLIEVHFEFRWDSPTGPLAHEESHAMRHFSVPELTGFLRDAGLAVLSCEAWMQPRPLGQNDWYGLVCAEKRPGDRAPISS